MTRFMPIVKQNNEIVAFLKDRDFINAIDTSRRALATQRALQDTSDLQAIHQHAGDFLDHCMLLSVNEDQVNDISDQTFVYQHGIMLHPLLAKDPVTTTTILIFNTALAHHLTAEAYSLDTSHQLLLKARQLYELAYTSGERNIDKNLLFQFAVINNIMVIDRRLGINGTEVSNDFFEYLVSIMMVFMDKGCERQLRHLEGFLVNILSPIENAAAA